METVKGQIRARCVIGTVSNGVLAAQHIHFKPQLPDWKLGAENKVGVHFTKDVFTRETSGYYQTWSDEAQGAYVDG